MSVLETGHLHWPTRTDRFNKHLTAISTLTLKSWDQAVLGTLLVNRSSLCPNLRIHDLGRSQNQRKRAETED